MSNPSNDPAPVTPAPAETVPPVKEASSNKKPSTSGKPRVWFKDALTGERNERKTD